MYIHRPKSPGTIRRESDVAKKAHDARIEKAKKKSNSASGGAINSAVGEVGKKVRAVRTTICLETACPAGKFVGVSRVNFKIFSAESNGDQNQTGGQNENEVDPHGSETRDKSVAILAQAISAQVTLCSNLVCLVTYLVARWGRVTLTHIPNWVSCSACGGASVTALFFCTCIVLCVCVRCPCLGCASLDGDDWSLGEWSHSSAH